MYVCAFSSSFSFSFSFSREQLETISTLEAKVGRRRLNLSTTTSLPPLIDLVYSARPPRRRRGRRRSGTQSCVALCWAGLGWAGLGRLCVDDWTILFSFFSHASFFLRYFFASHRLASFSYSSELILCVLLPSDRYGNTHTVLPFCAVYSVVLF